MTGRTTSRLKAREIFAAPAMLCVLTLIGLGAGLLGEDWWDVAAAALVSIPVLTLLFLRLSGRG